MAKNGYNKRARRKRIWAIVCAAAVALAFLAMILLPIFETSVYAATESELKKQLTEATNSRKKAQEDLNNIKNQSANTAKEAAQIDAQINKAENDIANTEAAILQNEQDILNKSAELAEAEQQCVEYDSAFKTRARIMYEKGTSTYLEVLLGAESFGDFISRVELVRQITQYDKKILSNLITSKNTIAAAKTALEEAKLSLEYNKQSLEATRAELNDRLESKQLLLKQLEADKAQYEKALKEEEAEEKKLQSQLAALAKTSTAKYTGTGRFNWPVPSSTRITSSFGYRIHPILGYKRYHSGIDIGASYGSAIVAAEAGTVSVATYSSGYGKYLVISHGSGITTLYGHCSSLLVNKGDTVTKGQQIAKIGSTGLSTGNHLHFEVRINGSATDPLSYVR
ncbi:MAG: peptidoglycan DD-metalloendopeptidase family protein [Clostridia bacterium]|nr:peptidoglycan DD-metalloendopeptidase family protein [Clostridia bacterium]